MVFGHSPVVLSLSHVVFFCFFFFTSHIPRGVAACCGRCVARCRDCRSRQRPAPLALAVSSPQLMAFFECVCSRPLAFMPVILLFKSCTCPVRVSTRVSTIESSRGSPSFRAGVQPCLWQQEQDTSRKTRHWAVLDERWVTHAAGQLLNLMAVLTDDGFEEETTEIACPLSARHRCVAAPACATYDAVAIVALLPPRCSQRWIPRRDGSQPIVLTVALVAWPPCATRGAPPGVHPLALRFPPPLPPPIWLHRSLSVALVMASVPVGASRRSWRCPAGVRPAPRSL